jgi:hypothetical protein
MKSGVSTAGSGHGVEGYRRKMCARLFTMTILVGFQIRLA